MRIVFDFDDTLATSKNIVVATKDGATKLAKAKFTYIYREEGDELKIVLHNSGLTPNGIQIE